MITAESLPLPGFGTACRNPSPFRIKRGFAIEDDRVSENLGYAFSGLYKEAPIRQDMHDCGYSDSERLHGSSPNGYDDAEANNEFDREPQYMHHNGPRERFAPSEDQRQVDSNLDESSSLIREFKHLLKQQTKELSNQMTGIVKQEMGQVVKQEVQIVKKEVCTKLKGISAQVASLSRTMGAQIEEIAREKAKALSKARQFPFLFLSTPTSFQSAKWRSLDAVCEWLKLSDGERRQVLDRVCLSLKLKTILWFTRRVVKSVVAAARDDLQVQLVKVSDAHTLNETLTCINSVRMHKSLPPLIKRYCQALSPFLASIKDSKNDVELQGRVEILVKEGRLELNTRILFMLLVCMAHPEHKVLEELEVDIAGECKRTVSKSNIQQFDCVLMEAKTSKSAIKKAKKQLQLRCMVIESVVCKAVGKRQHSSTFHKVILVHDVLQDLIQDTEFYITSLRS